jgi:virulence-associated protein VagC
VIADLDIVRVIRIPRMTRADGVQVTLIRKHRTLRIAPTTRIGSNTHSGAGDNHPTQAMSTVEIAIEILVRARG